MHTELHTPWQGSLCRRLFGAGFEGEVGVLEDAPKDAPKGAQEERRQQTPEHFTLNKLHVAVRQGLKGKGMFPAEQTRNRETGLPGQLPA